MSDSGENKEIETLNEEVLEDANGELNEEPEYVTREINLDDLYDGAVNNTVVIDPITNSEILLNSKKPNFTILGIVFAIGILLVLYYVNNKSDFGRTTKNVAPKTTTTETKKVTENNNGILACTYQSKSDAETQNVSYNLNYENNKPVKSTFNYIVVSLNDTNSAVVDDLKSQYETFFINNASSNGNNVKYEKDDRGFTFIVETNYLREGYNELVTDENKTILFVKPSLEDNVESLKNEYTNKGFSCSLTSDKVGE